MGARDERIAALIKRLNNARGCGCCGDSFEADKVWALLEEELGVELGKWDDLDES